jgi:hypothetical protein
MFAACLPKLRQILSLSLLCVLCASVVSPSAHAQGCALCYTTAAAAGAAAARSLNFGILTLLVPALLLFVAVFVLLLRRAHAST